MAQLKDAVSPEAVVEDVVDSKVGAPTTGSTHDWEQPATIKVRYSLVPVWDVVCNALLVEPDLDAPVGGLHDKVTTLGLFRRP